MRQAFRIIFLFLSLSFLLQQAKGQDIHLTQFYNAPLNINPASTGDFIGDWRLSGSYRHQWGAKENDTKAFQTTTIGYDAPFSLKGKNLAAGFFFVNDQPSVQLSFQRLYASGGLNQTIGKNSFNFGLQLGLVNMSTQSFLYPTQYNSSANGQGGRYDENLSNGETDALESNSSIDVNTGISWSNRINEKIEAKAGFAFFHIYSSNSTLMGATPDEEGNTPKHRSAGRQAIYITPKYLLTPKIVIAPHIQFMYSKRNQHSLLGSNVMYLLPENSANIKRIYGGFMTSWAKSKSKENQEYATRTMDRYGLIIGAIFPKLNVGFSYDITLTSLAQHFGNPFEITFIYIAPATLFNRKTLPCERL